MQLKDLGYILVTEARFGLKLCVYVVIPNQEKERVFYRNYGMYLKIINDWNNDYSVLSNYWEKKYFLTTSSLSVFIKHFV